MGANLSAPNRTAVSGHDQLEGLPGVVYKESLGGGRLLKTLLGIHDELGPVCVKAYTRRPGEPGPTEPISSGYGSGASPDPASLPLEAYAVSLQRTAQQLSSAQPPHVLPFVHWEAGPQAAYLVRPHLGASVYQRLATQPFLSDSEKRCIAWQMLRAVEQAHACGVCHGDLKLENFLVTSWNWVLLTDFSPFKPPTLPADNPADFSLYFDAGSRRRCYVAPERFIDPTFRDPSAPLPKTQPASSTPRVLSPERPPAPRKPRALLPSMDIFSLGCCLAELFLDGRPLFDLGQLLGYRAGTHDPSASLALLPPDIQALVAPMLHLDPALRPSAAQALARHQAALVPPPWEAHIYPTLARWASAMADHRAASLAALVQALAAQPPAPDSPPTRGPLPPPRPLPEPQGPVPASLEGVIAETEVLSARLMSGQEASGPSPSGTTLGLRNMAVPVRSDAAPPPHLDRRTAELLMALVTSTLRGCRTVEARTVLLRLLARLCPFVTVDVRAGRALPYLLTALSDPTPQCRLEALRALGQGGLLPSLDGLPPHEQGLVTDYLLPSLSALPGDPEDLVRDEAIAVLAEVAHAVRRMAARDREKEGQGEGEKPSASAEAMVSTKGDLPPAVSEALRRQLDDLSSHASTTSWTRLSLLRRLLLGGGQGDSDPAPSSLEHPLGFTDDVLGLAITFLNDREMPQIRAVFFDRVGALVPPSSEAFLLPLLEDQLAQGAEGGDAFATGATASALHCATVMAKRGVLSRRSMLRLCPRVLPLLRHASPAVQHAACALLQAACTALPPSDAFVFVRPLIKQAVALPGQLTDPLLMVRALNSREAQLTTPLLPSTSGRRVPDRLNPNAGYLPEERVTQAIASASARDAASFAAGASAPSSTVTGPVGQSGPSSGPSSVAPYRPNGPVGAQGSAGGGPGAKADLEPRALTRDLLGRTLLALATGEAPRWTLDLPPGNNEVSYSWMLSQVHHKEAVFGVLESERPDVTELAQHYPQRFESRFHRARKWLFRQMAQSQQVSFALSASALQASPGVLSRGAVTPPMPRPMSPPLFTSSVIAQSARTGSASALPNTGVSSIFTASCVSVPHLFTAWGHLEGPQTLDSPGVRSGRKEGRLGPGAAEGTFLAGAAETSLRRTAASLQGQLVGHLTDHRSAVHRIAVGPGGSYFSTCSDDGTCRLYPSSLLDPLQEWEGSAVYSGHEGRGHVISVVPCMVEGPGAGLMASACDDGSLHVWDPEVLGQGGGASESDRACLAVRYLPDSAVALEAAGRALIYASRDGRVGCWDLRSPSESWSLQMPCWRGLPRHLLPDPSAAHGLAGPCWLVVGASRGHMSLWDTRFLREVAGFRHPTTPWIEAMTLCRAPTSRLGLAPGQEGEEPGGFSRPRAYVASAHHEVALWDIADGRCLQVFKVVGPEEPEEATREAPAALGGISQAIRGPGGYGPAQQPSAAMPGRSTSIRSMLPFPSGQLVTAGNDPAIRLWDPSNPSRSRPLVGRPRGLTPLSEGEESPLVQTVAMRQVLGIPVIEEITRQRPEVPPIADAMQPGGPGIPVGRLEGSLTQLPASVCHADRVLSLAWLEAPWNESYLFSSSRDGVVKAWR